MQAAVQTPPRQGLARVLSPRRVLFALGASMLLGLVVSPIWIISKTEVIARAMLIGLIALAVFGLLERWPRRLPSWLARWALQVCGVAISIPIAVLAMYLAITMADTLPFWKQEARVSGFFVLSATGILIATLMALGALLRQREQEARNQALAFELQLSRAYLEIMQMRMPDRLQFSVEADPDAAKVRCPPTSILTLVENAIRHGIDPSEDGGRIDVRVSVRDGRCLIEVSDTGIGLQRATASLGTGLATLRERLELAFDGDATVTVTAALPRGARRSSSSSPRSRTCASSTCTCRA